MNKTILGLAAGAVLAFAAPAAAQVGPPLERFESEVFDAAGEPPALARKAQTCMAQILKPGLTDAPTILNADIEGGVVVANNAFTYGSMLPTRARSTVTFEARSGRFRLVHSSIEHFLTGRWHPVYTHKFGGSEAVKAQLQVISAKVATCIRASSDW